MHRRHEIGVPAKHDVRTTARHVGSNGDRALSASLSHDRRFTLVVLGVQDLVRNAVLLQFIGQVLGLLHAGCSDQDRLTHRVPLDNVFDDRVELRIRRSVHQVWLVYTDHRAIRRNGDDSQVVDLIELRCFCHRRTGHARQLVVEAEEVLQCHGGKSLILRLDLHTFFGLDRLV